MASVGHHLVARGVDEFTSRVRNIQAYNGPTRIDIPPWGYALLCITTLVFYISFLGIRYTYGEVVATLAMIEEPKTTAIVRTAPEDSQDPDAPLLAGDEKAPLAQELLIVQNKPLTGKFRTIIKHLRQRGGRLARFRGFHIFLGYMILFHLFSSVILRVFGNSMAVRSLAHILVSVGLCRISLLWNHVVISEPSKKSWFRRMIDRKTAMKIVFPTVYFAAAQQLMLLSMVAFLELLGLRAVMKGPVVAWQAGSRVDEQHLAVAFVKTGAFILFAFANWVVIQIPAEVMLARVQASLLAEEEEPVVPFDRTFGGQVIPEVAGGMGRLGMPEAWKSFDWNSRVRLFKIYVKVAMMQTALVTLFVITFFAELRFVMGKEFDQKILAAIQAHKN